MTETPEEPRSSFDRWEQRPALGRRGLVLMVGVVVVIAATAFGVVSLVSRGSETQATAIKVPTSDWIPGQASGTETIRGNLAIDERRCTFLRAEDGSQLWPVWPAGFYARLDGAGRMRLYDGADHLVARDGEGVQATGTYATSEGFAGETCLPRDGDVAVVQSEVTLLR